MMDPTISESDLLKLQLAGERVKRLEAEVAVSKLELQAMQADVTKRYGLGIGDTIDQGGRIHRVAHPIGEATP